MNSLAPAPRADAPRSEMGAPSDASWFSTLILLTTTYRGWFALVIFFGLAQAYAIRVTMSVAVIDITKEFGYSSAQQGQLLSAFYIGYMLPQMGAGWLAGRFGGFNILLFGILAPSVLTMLTPAFAGSFGGLVALRILTGLTEGVTYPALHVMLAAWCPQAERATLLNVCWSGAYFGTATTFPLAGAIAGGTLALPLIGSGWRAVFYVQGALGVLWAALFALTCASTPAAHGWISPAERAHIEASTGGGGGGGKGRATPWRALVTSRAVWATVAAHFAHNYAFYLLLSELPTYLKFQLNFNLANAGAVSVLPYLACFAGANIGGFLGDFLIARGTLSTLAVRRTWFAVGELVPAACLVLAGFITSPATVVALVTISVGVSGISQSGYAVTSMDVAPHIAGVWMAFQNTFATMPGVLAPIITSALVDVEARDDPAHWRSVFFLSASISVFGVLVYSLGVRADLDPALAFADEPDGAARGLLLNGDAGAEEEALSW